MPVGTITKYLRSFSASWHFSLIIIGMVSVGYIFLEKINHGINMVDFEVFYKTADRLFHGEGLYQVQGDGDYVFKYAPASSVLFLPFILFPVSISKIIYWLMLCYFIVVGFYFSARLYLPELVKTDPRQVNTILIIAFAASFIHIERELVLGQVNWALLVIYLWMSVAYLKRRPVQLGFSLALSIVIKPFGLIFIPYLLLRRKTQALVSFGLFTFGLFLLPLLFYNIHEYLDLLSGWFNELAVELGNKQELASPRIHTIFSVLARYTPLRFIAMGATGVLVYQLIVLAIIGLAVFWFIRIGKGIADAEPENLALLIGLIPLLAFTNENAFLFLTPVIICNLKHFRKMTLAGKAMLITGVLFTCGNIRELWGPHLSNLILDLSIVSFGALMIIVSLFIIRKRTIAASNVREQLEWH